MRYWVIVVVFASFIPITGCSLFYQSASADQASVASETCVFDVGAVRDMSHVAVTPMFIEEMEARLMPENYPEVGQYAGVLRYEVRERNPEREWREVERTIPVTERVQEKLAALPEIRVTVLDSTLSSYLPVRDVLALARKHDADAVLFVSYSEAPEADPETLSEGLAAALVEAFFMSLVGAGPDTQTYHDYHDDSVDYPRTPAITLRLVNVEEGRLLAGVYHHSSSEYRWGEDVEAALNDALEEFVRALSAHTPSSSP